ncbi:hypothetical protein AVEN_185307-1 [Araneus ventricosus]|uniref:Uncharacterized protein n=1 Tax=Araneus ventricosus TaxID=182803 RepID=A0A4Y2JT18_ARAVE|nr:hypothetical protein AVEN_185307-1 [Araneus ventricosus]
MGLELNKKDIDELVEDHSQELTTEELIELYCVSQQEVVEEFFNVGLRSSHWGLRKESDLHAKTPQKNVVWEILYISVTTYVKNTTNVLF